MDDIPIPSIVRALTLGRGRRGHKDPAAWVHLRAQLLTYLADGKPLVWLAGVRELPTDRRRRMIAEACDAVLRSGLPSHEADRVCSETWQRWCRLRDVAACERVRRMGEYTEAESPG
jgi:hypothetical protein